MNFIQEQLEKLKKAYREKRIWRKAATFLSAVAVFCTTYALIIPAITWEQQLICEIEEHVHTEKCWEEVSVEEHIEYLTREQIENGEFPIGVATESVYRKAEETPEGEFVEIVVPAHMETVLVCGKEEHIHTEACFDAPKAEIGKYDCSMEEHVHTAECYNDDWSLKCTIPEHVHTYECLRESVTVEFVEDSDRYILAAVPDELVPQEFTWQWQTSEDGTDPWRDVEGANGLRFEVLKEDMESDIFVRISGVSPAVPAVQPVVSAVQPAAPVEENIGETEPVVAEAAEAEQTETEAPQTEAAVTEAMETDPAEAAAAEEAPVEAEVAAAVEAVVTEEGPAEAEASDIEILAADQAEAAQIVDEWAEEAPAEQEPAETELTDAEVSAEEPAKTEFVEAVSAEAEPVGAEPTGAEPTEEVTSAEEPAAAEPDEAGSVEPERAEAAVTGAESEEAEPTEAGSGEAGPADLMSVLGSGESSVIYGEAICLKYIEPLAERTVTVITDSGISITVTGKFPENAEVSAVQLNQEETRKVGDAVLGETSAQRKDYAFDIKITVDGENYEPTEPIRLKFEGINVSADEQMEVYHLPGTEISDFEPSAAEQPQMDAVPVEEVAAEENAVLGSGSGAEPADTIGSYPCEKLEPEVDESGEKVYVSDSCSVYYLNVEFTVDFYYGEEKYSINGHSEGIALSELMGHLGVPGTIGDVETVDWTGDAVPYLTVTEQTGDWQIVPVGEPFTVWGQLTLHYIDGTEQVIDVSDATTDVHLYYGDIINDDIRNKRIFIHGTVTVQRRGLDSVHELKDDVTFVLASDFGKGASGSNNYATTIDGVKVALRVNADSVGGIWYGTHFETNSSGTNLTIYSECTENGKTVPFVIDGGYTDPTSGKYHDTGRHMRPFIEWGNAYSDHTYRLSLTDVIFQNNYDFDTSGMGEHVGGAAIEFFVENGEIMMDNVEVRNCYHKENGGAFYFHERVGAKSKILATMNNCKISNCEACYNNSHSVGGMIRTTGQTKLDLTMTNCTFSGNVSNKAAGGIYWNVGNTNGTLTLTNCTFENNRANGNGGAVYNNGVLIINSSTFSRNQASSGGAIYHSVYNGGLERRQKDQTSLFIGEGTLIDGNHATGNGGGVAFKATDGSVTGDMALSLVLEGGMISNNTASGNGGGIWFDKDVSADYNTTIDLQSGSVRGNTAAGSGGGIYFSRDTKDNRVGTIMISGGVIEDNTAVLGGGIFSQETSIQTQNAVTNTGIALMLRHNTARFGGGVYLYGTKSTTTFGGNNHIEENRAVNGSGGGIYLAGGATLTLSDGFIRANEATGTWSGNTAYNKADQQGVGGGIFVAAGTLNVGAPIVISDNNVVRVGVYGNVAENAADDIYTSGVSSKIKILDNNWGTGNYTMLLVKNDGDDYYDKQVEWYEDFHKFPEAYYSSSYFSTATTNMGRFRENDTHNIEYDPLQLANQFICTTIGPGRTYFVEYYAPDGTTLLHRVVKFKDEEVEVESITSGTKTYSQWECDGKVYHEGSIIKLQQNMKLVAKEGTVIPSKYDLDVYVEGIEAPGTGIEGAVFELYENSGSGWVKVGDTSYTTDENGHVMIEGLDLQKSGETAEYKLVQTQTSVGHASSAPILFSTKILTEEPLFIEAGLLEGSAGADINYLLERQQTNIKIVNNVAGGDLLPETGGIPTELIYILGVMLIAGALIYVLWDNHKIKSNKEREKKK